MRYAAPLSVLAILAGASSFGIFAASRPAHARQEPAPLPSPSAAGTTPPPAAPSPAAPSPEADARSRATQAAIHLSELATAALPPATPAQMAHHWFAGAVARVSQPAPPPAPARTRRPTPAPSPGAAIPRASSSASGQIGGTPFRVDSVSLNGSVLTLRQGSGWQAEKEVAIFFYGQHVPSLSKELVESPRSSLRDQFAPHINLSWTPPASGATAPLPRRTRSISQGYVLRIRYDSYQNGLLHGTIDLRLPGGDYVAGTFTAEAR